MKATRFKKFAALIAMLFFCSSAWAQDPNAIIQSAADELAAGLEGRKDSLAEDKESLYALIDEVLLPRFDRQYAARLVLGRHWGDASEAQRAQFIDAFYGSLLRKYADGVLEFDQDKIEILPFRGDLEKTRTTVKTMVTLEDGTEVPVNYGMVNRDSSWLMFDVTIEGISYVRNFRTELNAEIRATGIDAVIARLEGESSNGGAVAE